MFEAVSANFEAKLEGYGLLAFFAYAAATLLGGALLHYAVERPFLRLRERRERDRRALPRPSVEAEVAPVVAASPVRTPAAEVDAVTS